MAYSCSTQKNTAVTRAYHNLTAHYNAYFNGKEAYKQGVQQTAKALKDNYSLILPLFPYSVESAVSSARGNMDVAITKASKVIKLHSITKRPKRRKSGKLTEKEKEFYSKNEYCKWVDDSWQLMGQAHFYKHDFYLAKDNFEYIIKEYSKDPIKYKAMIWLARTYNELGEYDKAIEILENADGDKDFPKKLRKDLNLTFADNYLKQKKYQSAIPYLTEAIAKEKKKRIKARYQFILAQIYMQSNQNQMAAKLLEDVIKANPDYEMTFNAKIYRATSFDVNNGDSKEIKKQLYKMARDDKNIDYLDQIYYAIANVEMKEGNLDEAIELYKKSALSSTSNTDQKAMSFLALADIYFKKKDYENAQLYYDSTMAFINQEYPDYESLKTKSQNLNELIGYLTTIETEDSLQRVANMSEKERNKLIDKIIQKVIQEEEEEKKRQQEQQMNAMQYYQNMDKVNSYNNQSGGKWYFYNPAALSFGRSQFIKKWGNRKLEDNWRRKNKNVVSFDTEELADQNADSASQKVIDNKKPEYYLQNLPLNDSLVKVSNDKIIDAYYKSGEIYKEKLLDFPKAINQYTTLLQRFPENVYTVHTYYQLFKLYTLTGDQPNADKYKNLIISKYPESNYAKMLTNPNYLQEIEAKEKQMMQLYEETYNLYKKKDYLQVIKNCNEADSTLEDSTLKSKYSLLKALAIGEIRDLSNFRKALKYIIATYPGTEEMKTAEALYKKVSSPDFAFQDSGMVAYVGSDFYNIQEVDDSNQNADTTATTDTLSLTAESLYNYNPDIPHFYAMVVPANTNINRLKYNIFNFNVDRFNMFDFKVSVVDYDAANKIITIKILDNAKQAMAYYKHLHKDIDELFKNMKKPDYKDFIITLDNFAVLQNNKDINLYIEFFKKNYNINSSNE